MKLPIPEPDDRSLLGHSLELHPEAQTPHPDPDPATDLLEQLRILELG